MTSRISTSQTAPGNEVIVGLAEIRIANGPANFEFIGLGSCIGFCALDPTNNIAGAAHIMLPKSGCRVPTEQLGKFADTAVAELVRLMEEAGAERGNIVTAFAGGANLPKAEGGGFDIGSRNLAALQAALESLHLPVKAADAGGTAGRSLKLSTDSGKVTVRTIKLGEAVLCRLRD